MSNRSAESGRQHGLSSRSSSSSSNSSSTSSSSSSSPHRHHGRHQHAASRRQNSSKTLRSGTRSRSSSSGSSRSRTRSRSRSRERQHHRRHIRGHSRERDGSNYDRSEAEELSNHHEIDDSIRSDKTSESTTNGGPGNAATTALEDGRMPGGHTQPLKLPTSSSRLSGIQFGKPGTVLRPGIHMKLAQAKPPTEQTKKITIASAFNNDSDDEVEEMPPECKMRMRNIGRDTPTSSGPNSFGKTKQGFVDSKKLFEKSLREAAME